MKTLVTLTLAAVGFSQIAFAEIQKSSTGHDCVTVSDAPLAGPEALDGATVTHHFAGAMRVRQTWFCTRLLLTSEVDRRGNKIAWWSYGHFNDGVALLAPTLDQTSYSLSGQNARVDLSSGNTLEVNLATGEAVASYAGRSPHAWAVYQTIDPQSKVTIVE